MKFSSAVALAALVAPAASMSTYLQQLSGVGAGISQVPYYAAAPAVSDAAKNTADYMSALSASTGKAPARSTGAGLGSYLDALKAPMSGSIGASFADSVSYQAATAPAYNPDPAPAAPATPVAHSVPSASGSAAPTTAGYLGALGSSSVHTGGSGMRGYLDAIPTAPAARGGAGIPTYKDALAASNVVRGGSGIRSHADALSPYANSYGQTYGPSGTEYNTPAAPSFAMGSVSGKFDFSLEASAEIVEQLRAAGDRRVTLSGVINDVRY
jgi:hypothetical protein